MIVFIEHFFTITINYSAIANLHNSLGHAPFSSLYSQLHLASKSKSKSKLCYDRRSVGQSVLVSSTHLGLTISVLLLSDSCGVVDVGRSLWRENGSAVIIAAAPRQRSHSWVRVPRNSWPHFTLSDLRLPFSSPPTTRRITVELFESASTRLVLSYYSLTTHIMPLCTPSFWIHFSCNHFAQTQWKIESVLLMRLVYSAVT
jgi:hypothetical protein